MAFGRLRGGASLQEALAELETINRRLEADYPTTNRGVAPTDDDLFAIQQRPGCAR